MQYYLEMKLVNFGLQGLLLSYGMICSPRQQSRVQQKQISLDHNRLLNQHNSTTNQIATGVKSRERDWQCYIAEVCLLQHITDHVQLKARPNLVPTHVCVHKHCSM